jgi:hypothetical protein
MIPKKGTWVMIRGNQIPVEIPIDPLSHWFALPTGKLFWSGELQGYRFGDYLSEYNELSLLFGKEKRGRYSSDYENDIKKVLHAYFTGSENEQVDSKREELDLLADNGIIREDMIEQQVRIKTPFGDVYVQPHEYVIAKESLGEVMDNAKEEHCFIRYLSDSKMLKGKIADQVFYLKSRGIPHKEALALCFQNVSSQNLFYIEMHPEYQKTFTRNWDAYWEKKKKYCIEQGRLDLLDYGKTFEQITA